jgi:hypothetical protein
MEDMQRISGFECHGANGSFKGSVFIESKKYDALLKEIKDNISFEASEHLRSLQSLIEMEWAKENETDKRNDHAEELENLFKSAGFDPIYVKTINNEYCGKACCYKYPWIIVTTRKGNIKLGWRKSVMNLDWSDSDINVDGNEIFKYEKGTRGTNYIHCWGKDKAVEYLKKLNSEKG